MTIIHIAVVACSYNHWNSRRELMIQTLKWRPSLCRLPLEVCWLSGAKSIPDLRLRVEKSQPGWCQWSHQAALGFVGQSYRLIGPRNSLHVSSRLIFVAKLLGSEHSFDIAQFKDFTKKQQLAVEISSTSSFFNLSSDFWLTCFFFWHILLNKKPERKPLKTFAKSFESWTMANDVSSGSESGSEEEEPSGIPLDGLGFVHLKDLDAHHSTASK